jgi:hypothetical protein
VAERQGQPCRRPQADAHQDGPAALGGGEAGDVRGEVVDAPGAVRRRRRPVPAEVGCDDAVRAGELAERVDHALARLPQIVQRHERGAVPGPVDGELDGGGKRRHRGAPDNHCDTGLAVRLRPVRHSVKR